MTELRHCRTKEAELASLLLDPENATAEIRTHVDACPACRRELESLRATMGLMDAWAAPEPNPYFMTRLNARLGEAPPLGWFARLRSSFLYGMHPHRRPLATMALSIALIVGGGAYLGLSNWMQPAQHSVDQAVVDDLQTLDDNSQVLDTLENLSDNNNDSGDGAY